MCEMKLSVTDLMSFQSRSKGHPSGLYNLPAPPGFRSLIKPNCTGTALLSVDMQLPQPLPNAFTKLTCLFSKGHLEELELVGMILHQTSLKKEVDAN